MTEQDWIFNIVSNSISYGASAVSPSKINAFQIITQQGIDIHFVKPVKICFRTRTRNRTRRIKRFKAITASQVTNECRNYSKGLKLENILSKRGICGRYIEANFK